MTTVPSPRQLKGARPYRLMFALAIFIGLMGLLGRLRTDSMTPVFFNGTFAIITIVLGAMIRRNKPRAVLVSIAWTGILAIVSGWMAFKRIAAHETARAGSEFIFLGMALFALMVCLRLWKSHRDGWPNIATPPESL